MGTLGYSSDFPSADFFDTNPDCYADATAFDDESNVLDAALADFDAERQRVKDRMEYMNANNALRAEAELEVHRRLRQAGKTEKDINQYISEKVCLRVKIQDLYNLENPHPTKNTVEAYIHYGPSNNRRSAGINLHANGSLAEFKDSVKIYLDCLRDTWEPLESVYQGDRPWKYKWVPKKGSRKAKKKEGLRPLEMERDYQILIQQLRSGGRTEFNVVLSQGGRPEPSDAKKDSTQKVEGAGKDGSQDRMSQDIDSLFDDLDLVKVLEGYGRGVVKDADEGALQELATAYDTLETERSRLLNDRKRVDRDTARRAQSPGAQAAGPSSETRARKRVQSGQQSGPRSSTTPFYPPKKSSKR
ncbi:MAG: hypothetical protein LQ338_003848 [Usnochroma carphineum]|nr:MAG: hypothetical protein LQ338_003848 [Usnochroma carphineum]